MESRGRICGVMWIIVLLVLVVDQRVSWGQAYTCWGGCYNQCVQIAAAAAGSLQRQSERLSCYAQCLNSTCVPPRSPSDLQYYCQMGCAVSSCLALANDGTRLERCLGSCSNLCGVPT